LSPVPAPIVALGIDAAEQGRIPDALLRFGIRQLCAGRARQEARAGTSAERFAAGLAPSPIAVHTAEANQQHYEVPTSFFERVLGPYLKYSACLYADPGSDGVYDPRPRSLAEAEEAMLALSCERAGLEDGMRVLDLGCGWGSLTTWIAERHPSCRILAVSNSRTQRAWIESRCAERDLHNVDAITADAAGLELDEGAFDRVVSVEMFEHMRNWPSLFDRISRWLVPDGRFFLHVFCHRAHPYRYEDEGEPDWMARNFFSGGIMPSFDLPGVVDSGLELESRSLITIAILGALNHEELELHLRAARNTGVTLEQITEVLLHVAVYAGVPAANRAFKVVKSIYQEEGET